MTRHRDLPYLKIIKVDTDNIGCFMKVMVTNHDGVISIRWGLDDYTFPYLKKAITTRPFDKMPGLIYRYRLLVQYASQRKGNETKEYTGFLECTLNKQSKDIEFKCSEYFASNIEWFRTIKSVNELKGIEWKE